ncbi:hypothetical protein EQV77_08405 [Halobacillus fulvus]|nr:hypothetical protein EQV77_08405 [Halobacillus fulvus]
MSRMCSDTLLKKTTLLKECSDAYTYAVEVVQKQSPMAEDMCKSCAEVCYKCAEECLTLEEEWLGEELYQMCLKYADLCEKIIHYAGLSEQQKLKETM